MGLACKVSDINFALNPLCSYFKECQKNEIHFLYLDSFRNNFHQLKSTKNNSNIIIDLEVLPALSIKKEKHRSL